MGLCPTALYQTLMQDLDCHVQIPEVETPQSHAIASLKQSFMKKFVGKNQTQICRDKAIDAFMIRHLRDEVDINNVNLFHARGFLSSIFRSPITDEEIFDGIQHGPGSSIGSPSTTSFIKAAHCSSSVTSQDVYALYVYSASKYASAFYSAELLRRHHYGAAEICNYGRLTTVPKTNEIDRVITVQPTINALLQQGVKAAFESRLKRLGLDFEFQPKHNQRLAALGSAGHGLATVDFSAASDYISDRLVEKLFPSDVFSLCTELSPSAVLVDDKVVDGRIRYGMGNAITFPLQTCVFLALVYEVYMRKGLSFRMNENVAVFGDDVVLLEAAYDDFIELTVTLGMVPNKDKSFSTGNFRESCGSDWWLGFNIRGVYLRKLESIGDIFVIRNLLAAWSHRWCVALPLTLGSIDESLRSSGHWVMVPMHAPLNSGVRCFTVETDAWRDRNGAVLYYMYTPVPIRHTSSVAKYLTVHPSFAIQGCLTGSFVGKKIGGRPEALRYLRNARKTPHWGHVEKEDFWLYDYSCKASGFTTAR